MDLKSFYKKIDVDSIKNKLPPLPQIKIPKIKSRKIFKSSREDLSQQPPAATMSGGGPPTTPQSLPPPSAFIDRTPTRISTVSSLMNINYGVYGDSNQAAGSTYRTANTFEAENCPDRPENGDTASGGAAMTFSDKCKKRYKDISEFKLKNIFAKKTVVRKTEIEVDIYARQYEEELREDQEYENRELAEGYEFEFKEARRNLSKSSDSISPPDSLASGVPSPIRSELGCLQQNITPPLLARRRNANDEPGPSRHQLQRSMSEESGAEPPKKPNRSSLWSIRKDSSEDKAEPSTSKHATLRKSRKDGALNETPTPNENVWKLKSIRNRFASEDSGSENKPKKALQSQRSIEESSDQEKKGWKLSNIHLRHSEPSDKNSEQPLSSPEGKFNTIKASIKRLKERKPRRENSEESENEQQPAEPTKPNVSDQLKAGLRRLKLRERSLTFDEGDEKPPETTTNKLRNWTKSFKVKAPSEAPTDEDIPPPPTGPPPPPPPARQSTLMRKLNHIRTRKAASETGNDDESGDEQTKPKTSNFEKFGQARDKAIKKVNAQVQKMKMFHGKSRDSPTESSPEKPTKPVRKSNSEDQSDGVVAELPRNAASAVWTTNKVISQSLQSDDDIEMPRVLIHQDNSDQYESTLIIAVTRPAPPAPAPVIREIVPKTKYKPRSSEWIPNKSAVSSFLEMTPSPPPTSSHHLEVNRGHYRKRSMDSNDSDSWIPENYRNKSSTSSISAGLNKISENSEPWKVHSVFSEEKLYKTKSIDIFSNRDSAAFEDFEDEMKNVPIRRITSTSADSFEKSFGDSTDDDDDYDNSSRITRVKRPSPMVSTTKAAIETVRSESIKGSVDSNKACYGSPLITKMGQIGNSKESLDANYDENEELSSDDEAPTMAPSPPPSYSPPPPPLPMRKPPRNIPERNDSMVRLAKPLVKQASLRRHFSEEIEPSDLGKVNKLISRFEKNPSQEAAERIQVIVNDIEDNFEMEEKKVITKPKEDQGKNANKKRPAPIPVPVIKQPDIPKIEDSNNNNNNNNSNERIKKTKKKTPSPEVTSRKNLDNVSTQSPTSEYGSPIGSVCLSERISTSSEYGSPIGMAFSTKTFNDLHACRRLSNRSSLRDDDTFYSFESDEENNFYSFGESSSSSMKYTVEI